MVWSDLGENFIFIAEHVSIYARVFTPLGVAPMFTPAVLYRPPSPTFHNGKGILLRSTSSPTVTTCLQGASLRSIKTGGIRLCKRSPIARFMSLRSTPSASAIRFSVPNKLANADISEPLTLSNNNAGPSSSATLRQNALISYSGSTSSLIRKSSPTSSNSARKSLRGSACEAESLSNGWRASMANVPDGFVESYAPIKFQDRIIARRERKLGRPLFSPDSS